MLLSERASSCASSRKKLSNILCFFIKIKIVILFSWNRHFYSFCNSSFIFVMLSILFSFFVGLSHAILVIHSQDMFKPFSSSVYPVYNQCLLQSVISINNPFKVLLIFSFFIYAKGICSCCWLDRLCHPSILILSKCNTYTVDHLAYYFFIDS